MASNPFRRKVTPKEPVEPELPLQGYHFDIEPFDGKLLVKLRSVCDRQLDPYAKYVYPFRHGWEKICDTEADAWQFIVDAIADSIAHGGVPEKKPCEA